MTNEKKLDIIECILDKQTEYIQLLGMKVDNLIYNSTTSFLEPSLKERSNELYKKLRDLKTELHLPNNNDNDNEKQRKESLILKQFCIKIVKQQDTPQEFINIVNDEFWNLI